MSKKINKKIKPLLALSLCCAVTFQNIMVVGNAAEKDSTPTQEIKTISSDSQSEYTTQTTTDDNQEEIVENSTPSTNVEEEPKDNTNDTSQENSKENSKEVDPTTTEETLEDEQAPDNATEQDPGTPNMGESMYRSFAAVPNLDIVELTNPNAIGCGTLTGTDYLNVRSGPSTGHEVIGTLSSSDKIEILATTQGWYKIDFNGKEGYIYSGYVALSPLDKGIDVSKWNGKIDWQKVKKSGVSYAIIRAGYGRSTVDERFHENIKGAIDAGIKVGVYWFSYAASVDRVQEEAQKCLDTIAPYKNSISYPVFFDYEYDSVENRHDPSVTVTKSLATRMARAFMSKVEANGYTSGIYTNKHFSGQYFSDDLLFASNVWCAQYGSVNTFGKPYSMWQYTESGQVNGINGNVDLNYTTLKTFNTGITNPDVPSEPDVPSTSETGITTENVNFRTEASTSSSIITTIPKGSKVEVLDKSTSGWYKVKYNNQTGYVSSQYVKIGDTTPEPPKPPVTTETGTTTENVNLRTGASTSNSIITTIPKGSKVEVLDKSTSGWYKVKYNNQTGYVSSQYVKIGDTTPEPPKPPVVTETGTTTANVNLRTGASTSNSIITTIPKGSKVEVLDKSKSGWYKVKYNNQTGYVSSQYVQIGNTTPEPPKPPVTTETGTATANVNLRTGASTSNSIITTIPKGSKVEVLDKSKSGWYKVKYNGHTGYASSQYISIGGTTTPVQPTTETGTTTENVNLRTGASTSNSIITTIPKGSRVEVLDKSKSGWYKVKYNGHTGYASSQYVSIGGNVSTTTTGTTTANLNFRKSPSTSASIIATIPKGSRVEILEKNSNGWYKIKYNNKTGYASSQYIR